MEESICIEDFCGMSNLGTVSYWADYWPGSKVVIFGGDWQGIRNMPSDQIPTVESVYEWAKSHESDQGE